MAHEFAQKAVWQGGRDGHGALAVGGIDVPLSIPVQLKGPGAGSNPEELMLSALAACFSMTLGLIAVRAQPAVQRIETEIHGTVDLVRQPRPNLKFLEIRFSPHLWLAADQPEPSADALLKLCQQAEDGCFITQTVKAGVGQIVLDPPVVHRG